VIENWSSENQQVQQQQLLQHADHLCRNLHKTSRTKKIREEQQHDHHLRQQQQQQ
jgi:hypothetical protein